VTRSADWRIWLAGGAATGLAASPFWTVGGGWLRAAVAAVLVTAVVLERGRIGPPGLAVICIASVLAGLVAGAARLDAIDGGALREPEGPFAAKGFVLEPPSQSRGVARFPLSTGRGEVLVESDPREAAGLRPGTEVRATGELGRSPDWMAADLRRRGIAMVLRADELEVLAGRRSGFAAVIDGMRGRADDALGREVPDREAALSRGFVLGDDSGIDPRTVEDFRASGLAHLLAVSGQNIVLLSLLAAPVLAMLGFGPRTRLVAIAALILVYVPLAGAGPSIQRAGVMGLAGLVAAAATRAPSRAYALALAAAVTLAIDPRATGDIGWQLSFAAVVGIMLLARPLGDRIGPVLGDGGWRRALTEGAAVTLAATIATAPLTVLHFERFPVGTLLANLAAMPAVAPAMWMGMVSIGAGQVDPLFAVPFNLAGSVCLAWIAQVAEWFGRPGWASPEVRLAPPLLVAGSLTMLVLLWATLRWWRPGRAPGRRAASAAALVLLAVAIALSGPFGEGRRQLGPPPVDGARVEVLDVGQGDSILVRTREAAPILVDGGPPGGDLRGALDSAGIDRLGAVLLTHPDLDHYGGLLEVLGLVAVDRLLFDRAPREVKALARSSNVALERVAAGQVIRTGDVRLEVLWPPAADPGGATGGDDNARSVVLLLRWRGFRMLLTGDAEAEAVPMDPGPLDVLKVSHHGSRDAGLPALLDRTTPALAVISAGEDNPYGHPVPEVVSALESERVEVLRTDRDGTVSIVIGPEGWGVESGG